LVGYFAVLFVQKKIELLTFFLVASLGCAHQTGTLNQNHQRFGILRKRQFVFPIANLLSKDVFTFDLKAELTFIGSALNKR